MTDLENEYTRFRDKMNQIEQSMIFDNSNEDEIALWSSIIWAAWRMGEGQWSYELKGLFRELINLDREPTTIGSEEDQRRKYYSNLMKKRLIEMKAEELKFQAEKLSEDLGK